MARRRISTKRLASLRMAEHDRGSSASWHQFDLIPLHGLSRLCSQSLLVGEVRPKVRLYTNASSWRARLKCALQRCRGSLPQRLANQALPAIHAATPHQYSRRLLVYRREIQNRICLLACKKVILSGQRYHGIKVELLWLSPSYDSKHLVKIEGQKISAKLLQGLQPFATDITQKEKLQKIKSGTFLYLLSKMVRVGGL